LDRTVIARAYRRFTIRGFRGIDNLEIDRLAPINLLTGLNGAGKTSILEALFIHARPFAAPIADFDYGRGVQPRLRSPREAPWSSFFTRDDAKERVRFWGQNREQEWYVTLSRDARVSGSDPALVGTESDVREKISSLRVDLKIRDESQRRALDYYSDGSITAEPAPAEELLTFPFIRMSTGSPLNQSALAAMYTVLQESGRDDPVAELLRRIEPRLKRIFVWTDGRDSILHVDLGLGRSLPLPVVSDGLTRVAAAALSAAACAGGVLTIDEIENGVHVSILPEVWRGLALIADVFKTQIIATTHSRECTLAALEAVPSDRLMLHRVVRDKSGVRVQPYDSEMLETALSAGLAFR